jgi:hypothetical protein
MSRIKRTSPALVVAILALVAALVVPALALTRSEKRVVKKVAKVQANKQITKRAPGLSVKNSQTTGEVRNSGRVVLNDPTPGDTDPALSNLLTAGVFTIRGACTENFGGGSSEDGIVEVEGPGGSSFSGMRSAGTGTDEPDNSGAVFARVVGAGNAVNSGHLVAVAPTGQVVSVSASVEINDPAGDCVFGVTAIGP